MLFHYFQSEWMCDHAPSALPDGTNPTFGVSKGRVVVLLSLATFAFLDRPISCCQFFFGDPNYFGRLCTPTLHNPNQISRHRPAITFLPPCSQTQHDPETARLARLAALEGRGGGGGGGGASGARRGEAAVPLMAASDHSVLALQV